MSIIVKDKWKLASFITDIMTNTMVLALWSFLERIKKYQDTLLSEHHTPGTSSQCALCKSVNKNTYDCKQCLFIQSLYSMRGRRPQERHNLRPRVQLQADRLYRPGMWMST